ncbi:MAG: tail assembly protein [Rhodothalassiaceae bacterium]|nr:MAG: tail assembly protein [Rhodothalassiaceae bacterium]
MQMHWAERYIGIPYRDLGRDRDGIDCWGLIRLVLAEQAGIVMPSYAGDYAGGGDHAGIATGIAARLPRHWRPLRAAERPRAFDLVVFRVCARPRHMGVMVDARRFLHAPEPGPGGRGGTSRIEDISSPAWARRLEGVYRHVAL